MDTNGAKEYIHFRETLDLPDPESEKMTRECMNNGLPVIPFSYPTLYLSDRTTLRKVKSSRQDKKVKDINFEYRMRSLSFSEKAYADTRENESYVEILSRGKHNPYMDMNGACSFVDEGIFELEDSILEDITISEEKANQYHKTTFQSNDYYNGNLADIFHPARRGA